LTKICQAYLERTARAATPVWGGRLDGVSNGSKREKPAYHWFSQ